MALFTSENSDIVNHSVDTSFFASEKDRMTINQLASRAVNLGMYIINYIITQL